MKQHGFYTMIVGGEGCGKDSHAEKIKNNLEWEKYKVILTREPGGTPEAEQIREITKNKDNNFSSIEELFLIEAARANNYRNIVIPNLNDGNFVLKTRGWPCTETYQGHAGGIDLNFIKECNSIATRNVMPNLLFILDVPAEKGLEKEVEPDRFASKGLEYHQKVNKGYLQVAKDYPEISIVIPYIDGGFEEMNKQIMRHIIEKLER